MIRKAYIIGTLAVGLAVAATLHSAPSMDRIALSARNFRRNFQNLQRADSLNSVERFVFSLVLANTKADKPLAPEAVRIPVVRIAPRT